MSTKIEWTGETWNPVTGCNKVSSGCKNCYAEKMHKRLQGIKPEKYAHDFLEGAFPYQPDLLLPFKWKKPRMVFLNSMSDLFHRNIPFDFIDKVFAIMGLTRQHTYQILTKRPERMLEYFSVENDFDLYDRWNDAAIDLLTEFNHDWHGDFNTISLPNVWLGTSVENQKTADERIPFLIQVPAAVRFLSCEPLLGSIDLQKIFNLKSDRLNSELDSLRGINRVTDIHFEETTEHLIRRLHWIIAGGESGHGARPMHPEWVRSLRDQSQAVGVAFFFKQWGEWFPASQDWKLKVHEYHSKAIAEDGGAWNTAWDLETWGARNFSNNFKLGKKRSGRLLDGREWNEFPKVREEVQA